MKRDYRLYINDILEANEKIEKYTKEFTSEKLAQNEMTIDAVVRNFGIIGEATKNVPIEIRKKYPEIPWREMARMRDKLIHEYFGVNVEILWKTIKEDFPPVKPLIKKVLKELSKKT